MRILVLNSGSSSIKYAIYEGDTLIHRGHHERIEAYAPVLEEILASVGMIDVVGHRVVHGGSSFGSAAWVDEEVLFEIESLIPLAPLHNRYNALGMRLLWGRYPQIAVFDTAFHRTIPEYAARYPLPQEVGKEIRRYGFHGTSHQYVAEHAAQYWQRPLGELNVISFHFGNGDSICAIQGGKSIDTSMGFTPLEGLMMGSRCGDIDPQIVLYLLQRYTREEVDDLLNHQSGLQGVCGHSDMRDILASDKAESILAVEMFCYRAKKYLGSYMAILGRVDGIIFTGGIGEHARHIRAKVLTNLEHWGIAIDPLLNAQADESPHTSAIHKGSIPILVVHTDEERAIAEATRRCFRAVCATAEAQHDQTAPDSIHYASHPKVQTPFE